MEQKKEHILLVEDDENLGFILKDYLELCDYQVVLKKNGETGLAAFKSDKFDLCILDVMMPLKDGFTLAKEIKEIDNNMPIIFLTARSVKEDRIKGLKLGADDYISKPFSSEELSLRIKAILRRTKTEISGEEKNNYRIGKYKFDVKNQLLKINGQEKRLTKRETDMLKMLCRHKNNLLRRDLALKVIWGANDYFMGRSMDVYITKLRKYLKDDSTVSILNIHGSGFKLEIKNS